jgi:hypothetical protein
MQLGSDVQIRDGLLAENTLLREKPRLGFERTETTVHQASIRLNYLNGNRVSSTVVFEGRPVSLMAQQQSSSSTGNPNAAAEQHQYDLVVERTNNLLGTDDAADHIDSNGKLVGGNYEFSINNNDDSDKAFRSSLNAALGEKDGDKGDHAGHGFLDLEPPSHRIGFTTSLHHDNDALHVDHFNGGKFPIGTLLHGIVDYAIGSIFYGNRRAFSYSGVQ